MMIIDEPTIARNISDPCPAGNYRSSDQTECQVCQENHVSSKEGAASCTPCEDGQVANNGKTKCGMFNMCSWSSD